MWPHIPEDINLQRHRRGNLRSYFILLFTRGSDFERLGTLNWARVSLAAATRNTSLIRTILEMVHNGNRHALRLWSCSQDLGHCLWDRASAVTVHFHQSRDWKRSTWLKEFLINRNMVRFNLRTRNPVLYFWKEYPSNVNPLPSSSRVNMRQCNSRC
jgi:hypothetical protein